MEGRLYAAQHAYYLEHGTGNSFYCMLIQVVMYVRVICMASTAKVA